MIGQQSPPRDPPTAEEIEALFKRRSVVMARPFVLGGLGVLKMVRRFDWDPRGLHHVERLEPPIVMAANHMSHADTAAILATLPRHLGRNTAVAAALDVFGGSDQSMGKRLLPLLVASGFHAFAFDRHRAPLRSIKTAVELIRKGWNLLLYPEGTRSRTGEAGPFKGGVGVIARFTGRPVVPIHLTGGDEILPCGRFMPRRGRLIVRYGAPMKPEKGESADDFTNRLREVILSLPKQDRPVTVDEGTRIGLLET